MSAVAVPTLRRSGLDALRSLKKYAAEALGEGWEVRLWGERGTYREPFAVVMRAGAAVVTGGSRVYADVTQPMAVHCYPEPAETVDESILRAGDVEDLMQLAFRARGVGAGRPARVPLYEWEGVPLEQTSESRGAHDFMRVADFATEQVPDAEDPRRIRVVADIRLSWRRLGWFPAATETLQDVSVEVDHTP